MTKKPSHDQLVKRVRELEESEEFLNTIIEHIPMLIFVKDAESLRFIRFNNSGERLNWRDLDMALG